MSLVINKLKNVAKSQINSIGFAATSSSTITPSMLIIAKMDTIEKIELVDAILIKLVELDTNILNNLSKITAIPWGIEINTLSKEKAEQVFAKGCDYLLFSSSSTTEFLLCDKSLGRIMFVDHALPTSVLTTLNNLPIEAVVLRFNHNLTIKDIMICNQINNLVVKPLIVDLPAGLQEGDLGALYNAGVSGLIIDWKQGSSTLFKELRNKIAYLPRRKAMNDKFIASIPQIRQLDTSVKDNEEDSE